jgi:hypothetical protein
MTEEFDTAIEKLRKTDYNTFSEWLKWSWKVCDSEKHSVISPAGLVSVAILQLIVQDAIRYKHWLWTLSSETDDNLLGVVYVCSITDKYKNVIVNDIKSKMEYVALVNAYVLAVKQMYGEIIDGFL